MHRVLGELADDVQLALERQIVGECGIAADNDLPHHRFARLSRRAERGVVRGHGAPAQHSLPHLQDRLLQDFLAGAALGRIGRQKDHPDAVCARRGQCDAPCFTPRLEKRVRHLKQHASAIASVGLTAARAAMAQVHQHSQRVTQDLVRAPSVDIGDKSDAARGALSAWVVEGIVQQTRIRHIIHTGSPLVSELSVLAGIKRKGHPVRSGAWVASSLSKDQRKNSGRRLPSPTRTGARQPQRRANGAGKHIGTAAGCVISQEIP